MLKRWGICDKKKWDASKMRVAGFVVDVVRVDKRKKNR